MIKESFEEKVAAVLNEGEFMRQQPEQAARDQLSPRYEARVRAEKDPIVEETKMIREMAEEVDDRYDSYMSHVQNEKNSPK